MTKRQLSLIKRRVYSANYRASREYGREEQLTVDEVLQLIAEDPHCFYCSRKLTPSKLSLDHKIPLAHAGSNSIDNIVLSCRRDNRYKRALSAAEYQRFLVVLHDHDLVELFFANYRPQSYRR